MEISGKKVVVVGGASGFGRASAELLASRGASVAILDRRAPTARRSRPPSAARSFAVDVTDFAGTEKVLQEAVDALGGLHVILTTAGGGIAEKTFGKNGPHSLETFRSTHRPQPDRHLQHQPARRRPTWPRTSPRTRRPASAASSSTPRRSPRSRARSARSPTPPPRPASPACRLTMARDLGSRRHPGAGHRAEPVRHRPDRGHPRRVRQGADQGRRVPEAAGQARGVRQAGRRDRREPDAQRAVHPPGRRPALRPQVMW